MKFAVTVLAVGVVGAFVASNLQGAVMVPGQGLPAKALTSADVTNSIPQPAEAKIAEAENARAVRLIDLRSGATCKVAKPDPSDHSLQRAPMGPDCAASPDLKRIAYWRSTADGDLVMADNSGATVLKFAPGDGVLYESIYPSSALITIVPAKS